MRKFSKINESSKLNRNDIDKVDDILSDFKDNPDFEIKMYQMGANGLPYFKDIPRWINEFYWFEITIKYKKISKDKDFLKDAEKFTTDINNTISHLEDIGKVFYKTKIENSGEYLNGSNYPEKEEDRFIFKNYDIRIESKIKVFPN
jgi:hypothetical protein